VVDENFWRVSLIAAFDGARFVLMGCQVKEELILIIGSIELEDQ
jgi:hypothetical protein